MRRDTIRRRRDTNVCGQETDADFLLLDRGFGILLDVAPDLADAAGVEVGAHGDGLDEEFVATAGVRWRIFFHGLQEDLDFDVAAGFDAAGVWADAVSATLLVIDFAW